eukprot:TRINITY_DN5319_c0_g1_i3.p1 TRINITY_DN5319_c0_g1~~TRINITY_DN5319_c0_g1_i3.p1  ORF type:complete len:576 (-),score=93.08 TRINITY_DN5319_c0_g1_i3:483-2093(-)
MILLDEIHLLSFDTTGTKFDLWDNIDIDLLRMDLISQNVVLGAESFVRFRYPAAYEDGLISFVVETDGQILKFVMYDDGSVSFLEVSIDKALMSDVYWVSPVEGIVLYRDGIDAYQWVYFEPTIGVAYGSGSVLDYTKLYDVYMLFDKFFFVSEDEDHVAWTAYSDPVNVTGEISSLHHVLVSSQVLFLSQEQWGYISVGGPVVYSGGLDTTYKYVSWYGSNEWYVGKYDGCGINVLNDLYGNVTEITNEICNVVSLSVNPHNPLQLLVLTDTSFNVFDLKTYTIKAKISYEFDKVSNCMDFTVVDPGLVSTYTLHEDDLLKVWFFDFSDLSNVIRGAPHDRMVSLRTTEGVPDEERFYFRNNTKSIILISAEQTNYRYLEEAVNINYVPSSGTNSGSSITNSGTTGESTTESDNNCATSDCRICKPGYYGLKCDQTEPGVFPLVNCVSKSGNSYTVYFGYINDNPGTPFGDGFTSLLVIDDMTNENVALSTDKQNNHFAFSRECENSIDWTLGDRVVSFDSQNFNSDIMCRDCFT